MSIGFYFFIIIINITFLGHLYHWSRRAAFFLGTPGDRHGILIGPGALATRASMAVSDTIQIPLNRRR